jgi:TPR repeat protein
MVAFVNGIRAIAPGSVADLKLLRGGAVVEQPVTIGGRFTDNLAAAEAGNAAAQAQVGTAYAEGQGVEKDLVLARAWHLKAAEQGQVTSQVVVGFYYANGIGGPPNDQAAVEWYQKAAAADQPMALNNLGAMYSEGRGGLPKDQASAVDLYRRAAALGNELSANNLKSLNEPLYAVADIQRALADLGLDPGPVDGKMGGKTRAAIRAAQQQLGLAIDGSPSLELLIALNRAKQSAGTTTPSGPAPPPSAARPPPPGALGDLDSLD